MNQATPIPPHNCRAKIRALWEAGAIPRDAGLHMIDIAHEDWCGVLQGKRCNCDPDIALKATVPRAMH
jgi:hypothetical protein